jgi:gas vesicle protein
MFRWLQGFIAGGTLGYIAGVLLAPKSGEEMRRELVETSEDLITEASGYVSEMKSKGDQAITELKGRGERIKEKANTYLGEAKLTADKIARDAKPIVDKVVNDANAGLSGDQPMQRGA